MTTLMRWNPMFAPTSTAHTLRDEMDRLFDGLLTGSPNFSSGFSPATDVLETPEAYLLHLDLPGASARDTKVTLTNGTLTIRGERKFEPAAGGTRVHYNERGAGAFERSFKLGTAVRGDQVQATFKDGVLEVRIPKADEAKAREIEIQIG